GTGRRAVDRRQYRMAGGGLRVPGPSPALVDARAAVVDAGLRDGLRVHRLPRELGPAAARPALDHRTEGRRILVSRHPLVAGGGPVPGAGALSVRLPARARRV